MAILRVKLKAPPKQPPFLRCGVTAVSDNSPYNVEIKKRLDALPAVNADTMPPNKLWCEAKETVISCAKETLHRKRTRQISEWISEATRCKIKECRALRITGKPRRADEIKALNCDIRRRTRDYKDAFIEGKGVELEEGTRKDNLILILVFIHLYRVIYSVTRAGPRLESAQRILYVL